MKKIISPDTARHLDAFSSANDRSKTRNNIPAQLANLQRLMLGNEFNPVENTLDLWDALRQLHELQIVRLGTEGATGAVSLKLHQVNYLSARSTYAPHAKPDHYIVFERQEHGGNMRPISLLFEPTREQNPSHVEWFVKKFSEKHITDLGVPMDLENAQPYIDSLASTYQHMLNKVFGLDG